MAEANFEQQHQFLEKDIELLSRSLQSRYEGRDKERLSGEEMLKESLQTIGGGAPSSSSPQKAGEDTLLPGYMSDAPEDVKLRVEELLDTAIHKGMEAALKEAKKSGPYVLDAFHDSLVEKIYPELQRRGLVK